MPFRKISDLPAGTAQGGELIPATQSGVTRRLAVGNSVGAIPYIDPTLGMGVIAGNNAIAIGGQFSSNGVNDDDRWVRFVTIIVSSSSFRGASITALVKHPTAALSPVILYAYVRRDSETPPPVSIVSIGLEPLVHNAPKPMVINDLAAVETSPGVIEIWMRVSQIFSATFSLLFSAIVVGNANIVWPTQGSSRTSSPPSPTSGGAFAQWSSSTSRLNAGRIVAVGSGSNGSYIRFSDGTQILWHTIPSSSFGSQLGSGTFTDPYRRIAVWAFPAAFSATPVVQATAESIASGIMVAHVTSRLATSAHIRVDYAANNAVFTANLLVIGRWY